MHIPMLDADLLVQDVKSESVEFTIETLEEELTKVWQEIKEVRERRDLSDTIKSVEIVRLMEVQNELYIDIQRLHEKETRQLTKELKLGEIGAKCIITGGVKCKIEALTELKTMETARKTSDTSYYDLRKAQIYASLSEISLKKKLSKGDVETLRKLREELSLVNNQIRIIQGSQIAQ